MAMFVCPFVGLVYILYLSVQVKHSSQMKQNRPDFHFLTEDSSVARKFRQRRKAYNITLPAVDLKPSFDEYPVYTNLLDIIVSWNPDNPDPPASFNETLQHFNYSDPVEQAAAVRYREAEVPFKLYDVPEFNEVVAKWTDEYLISNMESSRVSKRVDRSESNHFKKWQVKGSAQKDVKRPTEVFQNVKFQDWLQLAHYADDVRLSSEQPHYYFLANDGVGREGRNFISRDLPLFSTRIPNLFVTDVNANKAIGCRFSTRGVISEDHYDNGKVSLIYRITDPTITTI
jgi:hypothetical protein